MKNEKVPKVGISLLAYNQGKFVDEAIESLKKQTFQDFEVFLADDGSDDGFTREKLEEVEYDKITQKFLHKENIGNAKRRAQQYKIMKNEYILDMSADDVLASEFLEKTVKFLEENDEYGAVSVDIKLFDKQIEDCYAEKKFDAKTMKLNYMLARNQVLGSSLMRKAALDKTDLSGGFTRYQDWDRWISMLEAGWKIGLVPEFLFYYRQVPSSLSHSASVADEMEIREKLLKKHAKSYEKYYKDVILNMEQAFLEVQEGKNWLEGQYFNLNKEVDRLNKVISELATQITELKQKRLKAKVKRFLKRDS
ncbi:glycosyltransferase family 2 protein [Candidatus Saccharibacteria bacterium]|nr:glycosyltransferase family 2 protein [Candidatus Saccharibacteria bacterium]MBQ3445120.1 glycosyltransferase family 2 protein [Candidatus Saccharibacteria bacterium]